MTSPDIDQNLPDMIRSLTFEQREAVLYAIGVSP